MKSLGLRILPVAVAGTVFLSTIVSGCREEDPVRTVANPGALPSMVTLSVDTYISDSGYVKYHAQTDIWEVYDNVDTPFWRFPHPLVIDIFAPGMKPNAHVECDSAHYLSQRRLFRFDGNVAAVNVAKDTFLTPQLYWDQNSKTFYTDSFIHIVKGDRILEGKGFRSNEKMTSYRILRPTAVIPASELQKDKEKGRQNPTGSPQPSAPNPDPMYLPTPTAASQSAPAPAPAPDHPQNNQP